MNETIERCGRTLHVHSEILEIDGSPAVCLFNKRLDPTAAPTAERTLLFVHGATYASSVTFDMPLAGYSWMDRLALAGFDVWALDLRGYGRSPRPSPMNEPAEANPPIVHTDLAVADLGHVVEHILALRKVPRLGLVGYSWGSRISGAYAARNSHRLQRLVLYATRLLRDGPGLIAAEPPTGAYRLVSRSQMYARWRHGLSDEAFDDIANPEWVQAWLDAVLASDPRAHDFEPSAIRAPTGVVDDNFRYATTPYYDPGTIAVPTLVVVGEKDIETTPAASLKVFEALRDAPHKQFTVIGGCTHSMLIERRRDQLFDVVETFLRGATGAS
ncbi:MAG: alpha/beta fold hydrolase [Gammaproteobacteria bacterium]|nr:alpha/beta fold hydrolase [Gammaproteobacteria bacterium]